MRCFVELRLPIHGVWRHAGTSRCAVRMRPTQRSVSGYCSAMLAAAVSHRLCLSDVGAGEPTPPPLSNEVRRQRHGICDSPSLLRRLSHRVNRRRCGPHRARGSQRTVAEFSERSCGARVRNLRKIDNFEEITARAQNIDVSENL